MSNENCLCEACGIGTGLHELVCCPVDVDGSRVCLHCYTEVGALECWDAIRARRQRTAEPQFVDRNGVEIRIGDTIECAPVRVLVTTLHRDDAGITRADEGACNLEKFWTRIDLPADEGKPADYVERLAAPLAGPCSVHEFGAMSRACRKCGLTMLEYRSSGGKILPIDPPADEQTTLREAVIATRDNFDRRWSRQSLVEALLRDQNAPPPFAGYDDFEAERASREADDALATIERHVANLQRVHRLRKGPNRYHTDSDCLGEK